MPGLSALPCPSVRGRWLGVVARGEGGSGCLGEFGASRTCGHGSACGAAWEWVKPTAGERAGAPRYGMGSGFFGDLNQASPSGVSLPGFAADPCCAFWHFPAVPLGTSMPRTSMPRLSALRCLSVRGRWLGVVARGGGASRVVLGVGHRGLADRGAPAAWHGSGRGPRQGSLLWPAGWGGFDIFW